MKQIIKNKNDGMGWKAIGAGYSGLSVEAAKAEMKTLRRHAKEDGSGYIYKVRDVTLVPR